MFKKKFLTLACNGYLYPVGELEGFGFERIIIRNKTALLMAPRAIEVGPLLKCAALMRLAGNNCTVRAGNGAGRFGRNVIVLKFKRPFTQAQFEKHSCKLAAIRLVSRALRGTMNLIKADHYATVSDDECIFKRKFPLGLTPREARTFILCNRRKQSTLLFCDGTTLYYADHNEKCLIRGDEIIRCKNMQPIMSASWVGVFLLNKRV
jgi:hypothetical protein